MARVLLLVLFLCQVGFPDLAKAKGALQNVFKIVDRKSPIDPSSEDGTVLDSRAVRGELELQNVVFAYPARPAIKVFNNYCLSISAGRPWCAALCCAVVSACAVLCCASLPQFYVMRHQGLGFLYLSCRN
jgi:hypothetical protein